MPTGASARRVDPGDGVPRVRGRRPRPHRARPDRGAPSRPVQDRSARCWTLNSAGIDAVRLDSSPGRRSNGTPRAGRPGASTEVTPCSVAPWVSRCCPIWLRSGRGWPPRGSRAADRHDAVPDLADLAPLADAAGPGRCRNGWSSTGGPEMAGAEVLPGLEWGPVKLVIDDARVPVDRRAVRRHRNGAIATTGRWRSTA